MNDLTDFVRKAIAPEVPPHLYDEEYDAAMGMPIEDFLEEIRRPDITVDVINQSADFRLSVGSSIRAFEDAGELGMMNELYAQLAALATRRAAARIPELGYWD